MHQDLYSIEQVAQLLGLHPRTVRNYVREGRLKGARIGKQYRITREDLERFTGRAVAADDPVRRQRHVDVSSVVQVDAISADAASRVTNALMAAAKGERDDDQPLRIDSVYDEARGRLKVILTGGVTSTVALLKFITALTESER